MRSIFKFVTFHLLGGIYGNGPLGGSSGAEIYQRIHAISPSLLNDPASIASTATAASLLQCASLCQRSPACNAFDFSSAPTCVLANLTSLEERQVTDVDWPELTMASSSLISSASFSCHGGEDCCSAARAGGQNLCGLGSGDCGQDWECEGPLVCGVNNCLTEFTSNSPGSPGLWDEEDDCCTRRCSPERPCKHGEGTCLDDSDCEGDGFHFCYLNCIDSTWYPVVEYPNNTEDMGFSALDYCCRRACVPNDQCGENVIGCHSSEDCLPGLQCMIEADQPYCADVDECSDERDQFNKLHVCGDYTNCINSVGSFSCECQAGFHSWKANRGCLDIDECASSTGTSYCGPNTHCNNTIGSFTCEERNCYDGIMGCQASSKIRRQRSFIHFLGTLSSWAIFAATSVKQT